MLAKHGYECQVMDPASIEVPRRARMRKTDRLDAQKLLTLLRRAELGGERKAYSVVRVPTEKQEEEMRRHRERQRLVREQTGHRGRMRSICALQGIILKNPLKVQVDQLCDWDKRPLGQYWKDELLHEQQRLALNEQQLKALETCQKTELEKAETQTLKKVKKLHALKAVGLQSSWVLSHECFWRVFRNRKQVGSFAGLTGTPYDSGDTLREQGISKAGSGRVRTTMIELAWLWVRWQPKSTLTNWFLDHYVRGGTSRSKRKGIVAVARKLLVALWKYVEHDIMPEGAILRA
jgi:transposase